MGSLPTAGAGLSGPRASGCPVTSPSIQASSRRAAAQGSGAPGGTGPRRCPRSALLLPRHLVFSTAVVIPESASLLGWEQSLITSDV